ncbi:substrate-binding periplasmic protein [Dasania marina]|uniref:substrate-binding periplasmic protein n=1 Tax=Dasania marina TaxID=471499 RepID=UPI000365197F|nr:transporter substrate-binding domain-containing protein [Dasania marina]
MSITNSIIAVIALTIGSYTFAQETIRLAYGHNYPPFSWLEQGEVKGLQVDILTELFEKRLGIKAIHKAYPWKRAQWQVQSGLADAMLTLKTAKRSQYSLATEQTLIPVGSYLFTYINHPRMDELSKLDNVNIKDFRVVQYLGGSLQGLPADHSNIATVPEISAALKFLAHRRADLFIDNPYVTRLAIKQLQLDNIIIQLPKILSTEKYHLLISKKSKIIKLLPKIEQSIQAMKNDGTLNKLYKKYL